MTKLSINNLKGEKVSDITLNSEVFGIEVNELAMKKMVRLQLNASRQGTAKVKTRSEVSGGGRKPWKQKGTGRARQGSIRAAQWRKGGIVFGPTPRDYSFKINRKERVLALKSALVNKLNDFITFSSSSVYSNLLAGISFSKASFIFFINSSSNNASLSFVDIAFFSILPILELITSKSANINSRFIISISLIGSVLPST